MNLRAKNLKLVFIISCVLTLFLPTIIPYAHILYFVPLIVICMYQKTLITCVYYSLVCGLFIDLVSDGDRIGFYAMNYSLSTFILYPQKKNFFADNLTTLPLMTFFYSVISTSLEVAYFLSVSRIPPLTIKWVISDIIVMPSIDAVYAFIIFILPAVLFGKPQRKGTDYFMNH